MKISKKKLNNFFYFTIIRNPYDQFISYYHHSRSNLSFDKFTDKYAKGFFRHNFFILGNNLNYIDYYIKYENMANDILILEKKLKLNYLYEEFKKLSFNEKKKKKFIISNESKEKIYKYSSMIFKKFNYDK